MNVHIVSQELDRDRILGRLGLDLAEGTGWTINAQPDPKVSINLFMPYLEVPREGYHETKTAAWFTHKDPTIRGKVGVWENAARSVDIRLTSALIYADELQQYGSTFLVTPPVDREKFCIQRKPRNRKPVIGVSGYVYGGGRKGEALVKQLANGQLSKSIKVVGAGRDWPVPTKFYQWTRMQEFYQGLDVYLLTSSVEGVGYGPLEALACGIKVVIPWGVGVMDELPDMPGIERYEMGNFEDMERAVENAISTKSNPEQLRAATERYTLAAWCSDHEKALSTLMGTENVREEKALPAWQGKSGVYVVAFGEPARKCATLCINTIHQHMPGLPVALCSDRPLGVEDILIKQPEVDIGARSQKIRVYDLAPAEWEYVLYVDADTETIEPIPAFFEWLQDGYELVICKNPGKFHLMANMGRKDNTGECDEIFTQWGTNQAMQWNGGVFAFRRCDKMKDFFDMWLNEWERYGKRDQGALLRVLWNIPVKAWWLGNEWNLVEVYDSVEKCAGIIHHPMTARRWDGIVMGRSDSKEAWDKVKEFEGRTAHAYR